MDHVDDRDVLTAVLEGENQESAYCAGDQFAHALDICNTGACPPPRWAAVLANNMGRLIVRPTPVNLLDSRLTYRRSILIQLTALSNSITLPGHVANIVGNCTARIALSWGRILAFSFAH